MIERIEYPLTPILMDLMKNVPQKDKVDVLNRAGFSNVEIANLLEITVAEVRQYKHGRQT